MATLGPITIYPQGISLLVAIIAASYLFWRQGVRKKFEEEALLDFVLITLVGGIIGGRLFYFLFEQNLTWPNFLQIFKVWQGGGMLWYGSLVGGFTAGSLFAQRNFWDLRKIWDTAMPALLLGQAIGSLANHPLESLFFFLLFILFNYIRKVQFADGFHSSIYLISTAALRFISEFFRLEKTFFLGVNLNQIFSFVFLILGVVGLRWVYVGLKRSLKEDLGELEMKLKVPKISKLPKIPLAKFKKQLHFEEKKLAQQQRRLTEDDPLFEPGRTEFNPEMVAEAEEEIGHRRFAAVREAVAGRSRQVKKALSRMKKGKYGICADCGRPIDPARLKVDPSVTLCLECQEKSELVQGSEV
jgi:prolipoprotein diacylglyceryltransferase/RNA polymerase-binding transcription factor DksA